MAPLLKRLLRQRDPQDPLVGTSSTGDEGDKGRQISGFTGRPAELNQ